MEGDKCGHSGSNAARVGQSHRVLTKRQSGPCGRPIHAQQGNHKGCPYVGRCDRTGMGPGSRIVRCGGIRLRQTKSRPHPPPLHRPPSSKPTSRRRTVTGAPEPHLADISAAMRPGSASVTGCSQKGKRPLRTAFSPRLVAEGVECALIRKPQTCHS